MIAALGRRLRKIGHVVGTIPFLGSIGAFFGVATGTALMAVDSVMHGNFIKAGKQMIAGGVDTAVTMVSGAGLSGIMIWALDPASLILTGNTMGGLANKVTSWALDAPERAMEKNQYKKRIEDMKQHMGPLQPQMVTQGAVGWAPGMMPQQDMYYNTMAPRDDRHWFNQEANRRGVDPQQAYANYMRGEGGEHLDNLNAGRQRAAMLQEQAIGG